MISPSQYLKGLEDNMKILRTIVVVSSVALFSHAALAIPCKDGIKKECRGPAGLSWIEWVLL